MPNRKFKSHKKRSLKHHRKSTFKNHIRSSRRRFRGGSSGSNVRQQLVILCKRGKLTEYDDLTQQIMRDYWVNGKKDFFIHLDRNIKTFSPETLSCLKRSLTQLQEDAIPESMPHLAYIMQRGL